MSRAMLVCPEPLGSGQPAGIGIRFIEMARALRDQGHLVTVVSPDAGAVDGSSSARLSPETLFSLSGQHDLAVVQGHAANDFFVHARPIPTVVDLYDPFIVENLHYFTERGAEVFTHDHATLVNSVLRGDFFLCASPAQRLFYLGVMVALGRLNPQVFESDGTLRSILAIAPFGVQPPREPRTPPEHPAILFGGIYDWYDPIAAIDAVATARNRIPGLTLTFTFHPNAEVTPQGRLADAMNHARQARFDFVNFVPWVPYDDRARLFDTHSLALLTFPQSIETDLSMRTRVYDYLWGGLPIISSPARGTDELIERYGAGLIVDDGRFADAIVAALLDRDAYDRMVAGTISFVHDHQWPRALAPLLEFCRQPRFDETKSRFAAHLGTPEATPSIVERLRRKIGGRR